MTGEHLNADAFRTSDRKSTKERNVLKIRISSVQMLVQKPHNWSDLTPQEKLDWVYEAAEEFNLIQVGYEEIPRV